MLCKVLLVAWSFLESGAESGLIRLGDGCCSGYAQGSLFLREDGMSFQECLAACSAEKKCRALEHNPWASGQCALFSSPAAGLDCILSEKVAIIMRGLRPDLRGR